jgi:hypothetical protein
VKGLWKGKNVGKPAVHRPAAIEELSPAAALRPHRQ